MPLLRKAPSFDPYDKLAHNYLHAYYVTGPKLPKRRIMRQVLREGVEDGRIWSIIRASRVRQLVKGHTVVIINARSDIRIKYLIESSTVESIRVFARWLYDQLDIDGSYFDRVHRIFDNYIEATDGVYQLCLADRFKPSEQLLQKLCDAGKACFEQLRPIFEEDLARQRAAAIERAIAEKAKQAVLQEGKKHITNSKVAMAVEDIDTFIYGHRGLPNITPP